MEQPLLRRCAWWLQQLGLNGLEFSISRRGSMDGYSDTNIQSIVFSWKQSIQTMNLDEIECMQLPNSWMNQLNSSWNAFQISDGEAMYYDMLETCDVVRHMNGRSLPLRGTPSSLEDIGGPDDPGQ